MNLNLISTFLLFALFSFEHAFVQKSPISKKPNIIFILADDLGYTDVNAFATQITGVEKKNQYYETPNIDKLAAGGISFSQAYVSPLCAPTRSSILTGKNAAKLGFMTATGGNASTFYARGETPPAGFLEQDALWGDKIDIPQALINGYTNIALSSGQPQDHGENEVTIAEALKGYNSAFLGKWHLGGHGSEGYQPNNQGFKELAYFDSGSSTYYNWRNLWNRKDKYFPKMRQQQLLQGNAGPQTGKEYLTDDLTQQAVNFLQDQTLGEKQNPFFLYFCEFAVHSPLQAPKGLVNYFANKSTSGWNQHNNATIFLDEETDILFAVQLKQGESNSKQIGTEEVVQKWWAYMKDIMETNENNSPVSTSLINVFHLD